MHLRLTLATTAFVAGALVATLAPAAPPASVLTPSVPSTPSTTSSSAAPLTLVNKSSTPTKPRAARVAFTALSGVRKSKLRRQQPKQTKRWKKRAARAINASLQRRVAPKDGYRAVASFWACAFALARFVSEYGIPIVKVVRVVRTAVKHWGSIRKPFKHAVDGDLERVLGEDGADVFMAFVGAGDLLNDCVMSL